MGIKAIITYNLKTKELDHFIWAGKDEPPPLIEPKMARKKKRGRPRKAVVNPS